MKSEYRSTPSTALSAIFALQFCLLVNGSMAHSDTHTFGASRTEIASLQGRINHLNQRTHLADDIISTADSSRTALEHELTLMNASYVAALVPAGASLFASVFLAQMSLPLMFAHQGALAKLALATAFLSTPIELSQQAMNVERLLDRPEPHQLELMSELESLQLLQPGAQDAFENFSSAADCSVPRKCSPEHPLLLAAESLLLQTHDQVLNALNESDHWYSLELTSHLQARRIAEAEIPLADGVSRIWTTKKKLYLQLREKLQLRIANLRQNAEYVQEDAGLLTDRPHSEGGL